jgi:glucose/arabinose dehydrogenase
LGQSNQLRFTYVDGDPISFLNVRLAQIYGPTTLTFGPDEKLYVGTINGYIYKFTLNNRFVITETVVSSVIKDLEADRERAILGMTFDPMDTSYTPILYVSHSLTFHGEINSSSGLSINGKVSRILGANLDVIEDVVTGLPVSDHDHAVNGLEFGDEGQLYIQVGGNTNAGVVGSLSASHVQKDNVLSSATLVAYLSDPNFDGVITYDANDDGNMKSGFGVEIFASGSRNPYDLVLHSNGYLYGTDNGADIGYGDRSIGCGFGEELPEVQQDDKINLLQKGKYYGHANRKRGSSGDPRQCKFYDHSQPSDVNFTRPIVVAPSSANGIIEFQTNHFNGQLRGNLIYSKYKNGLHRVILTKDGTGVIPQSDPPIFLVGNHGLDVTQAPDGKLVDARYSRGTITYYVPIEASTTRMIVKGVFPRRGPTGGGSNLNVYGINFISALSGTTAQLVVRVGNSICPIVSTSAQKIVCTLPGGTGTVNVTVTTTIGRPTSIFQRGYRYITGQPKQ